MPRMKNLSKLQRQSETEQLLENHSWTFYKQSE